MPAYDQQTPQAIAAGRGVSVVPDLLLQDVSFQYYFLDFADGASVNNSDQTPEGLANPTTGQIFPLGIQDSDGS